MENRLRSNWIWAGSYCSSWLDRWRPWPVVFGLIHETQSPAGSQVVSTDSKVTGYTVSSIKPDKSGQKMTLFHHARGFSGTNITLKALIQLAYGVEENQILGAPKWLGAARYDIEAKVNSSDIDELQDLGPGQRRLMLQPLLSDRFQLKVHTEVKNFRCCAGHREWRPQTS